jgi:Domain of unknown function (DUF4407)
VRRLLIWLSGAQPDILRQSPADRPRYLGIGSAVLITSSIATISMTFALHTALKVSLGAAIFFALLWGLAIMSIDRWLVVSLHRQENRLSYIPLILVRLTLGLLFGFVISTPFVLQIFAPEINKGISLIQRQAADSYFARLKTDPLTKKIGTDQAAVDTLNTTIKTDGGSGTNPYQDPTVANMVKQRDQQQELASADYNQWQCQLYGLPPRACKPGNGPLARTSHARYVNAEALVTQDNHQISILVAQVLSRALNGRAKAVVAAKKGLPAAELTLHHDQAEQNALTNSFEGQNASNAGLLLRLRALDNVTASNTALNVARWLLFALFTTIECLPVVVKTLLNLGPETNYEALVVIDERKRRRVYEERALREQAAEIIGAENLVEEANRLAAARENYFPAIRERIMAAEQRVAEEIVREWERRESRMATDGTRWQRAARELFHRDTFRRRGYAAASDQTPPQEPPPQAAAS